MVAGISMSERICPVSLNHNSIISSCMPYHRVCNKSSTTGATNWLGTAYPSRLHEITQFLVVLVLLNPWFSVNYSVDHCLYGSFCFQLVIDLSVLLRIMISEYPFCIFKCFLWLSVSRIKDLKTCQISEWSK